MANKIYGAKNDEVITMRLIEILDTYQVPYEFYDFKDFPPTDEQLLKWGEHEGLALPINERSTFYKNNKRIYTKLSDQEKRDWLRKNNHLIIRPIIENEEDEILMMGGRPERIVKVVWGLELT